MIRKSRTCVDTSHRGGFAKVFLAAIPRSSQTALGAARVQTQMPHLRRYVVVAVCTQSGEFFSLIFDCVNSAVFQS